MRPPRSAKARNGDIAGMLLVRMNSASRSEPTLVIGDDSMTIAFNPSFRPTREDQESSLSCYCLTERGCGQVRFGEDPFRDPTRRSESGGGLLCRANGLWSGGDNHVHVSSNKLHGER